MRQTPFRGQEGLKWLRCSSRKVGGNADCQQPKEHYSPWANNALRPLLRPHICAGPHK
ncbi:hypothetical protein PO909_006274 [Leuciscus waleckii]